jgi:acyl carrier protein
MTMPVPSPNGLSQQIYDTLGDYLRRDPAALHPEDSLRDDLGLDSLQTIELV